jgi:hypothetical protein
LALPAHQERHKDFGFGPQALKGLLNLPKGHVSLRRNAPRTRRVVSPLLYQLSYLATPPGTGVRCGSTPPAEAANYSGLPRQL